MPNPDLPKNAQVKVEEEEDDELISTEVPWAARFAYLRDRGYLLRPRYRPGWRGKKKSFFDADEQSIIPLNSYVLDATRLADGLPVFLKLAEKGSNESQISQLLTSKEMKADPRNHSVPLLEVIPDCLTENEILVLPVLRRIDFPVLQSIRECVDFVEQTLQGLLFMHEHGIAHRDCAQRNIMMDARKLFPEGWHPQRPWCDVDGNMLQNATNRSRTAVGGVRYYYVDFGLSSLNEDLVTGSDGVEKAPELSKETPYNPFKLDVYILGMVYKRYIVESNANAHFVAPLVETMVEKDPEARPTVQDAYGMFLRIRSSLSAADLRQRLHPVRDWSGQPVSPEPPLTCAINDTMYTLYDYWWTLTRTKDLSNRL